MTTCVADASALISLGCVADGTPDPLSLCLERYDVIVPRAVVDELEDTAAYDDAHGDAAARVLDRSEVFSTRTADLDADFPLDDGENAAVSVANECDAAVLLCDKFNRLGLIHASLADTRLVTTPTLLSVFVRSDVLSPAAARTLLDEINGVRSWDTNSYVQRAQSFLDDA